MNHRKYLKLWPVITAFLIGFYFFEVPHVTSAQGSRINGCSRSAVVNISTAVTTRLIQNDATTDSSASIYICSVNLTFIGTATANQLTFQYGTGATCGTGLTSISGPFTSDATAGVMKVLNMIYPFAPIPTNKSLCALTSQAGVVSGVVSYDIF